MDNVHHIVSFLWLPKFRPVPLEGFARESLSLQRLTFVGKKREAHMNLSFVGKMNSKRLVSFLTSIGRQLEPQSWNPDGLDMQLSFDLGSGDEMHSSPPERKAEKMMHKYLALMNLCGVAYEEAQVPRIVLDLVQGHSADDVRAVPLGKYLVMKVSSDLQPHLRMRHH